MNKMLMFPMAILFILTLYSVISGPVGWSTSQNITSGNPVGNIQIPSYNLWIGTAAVLILITATTLAIAAGFNLFGSGFGPFSQRTIFYSALYFGLWGCLSVASIRLLFTTWEMSFIWVILTVIYVFGFSEALRSGSEET